MAFLRPLPPFTPCKRGDQGLSVKYVQEWLGLNNVIVEIDGDFGPATEAAVRKWLLPRLQLIGKKKCQCCGAESTATASDWNGVVGELIFWQLSRGIRLACTDVAPDPGRGKPPLRDLVVLVAEQHLKEHPREIGGQNRGPWVRYYMGDESREGTPWAWCAGFVNTIVGQAAQELGLKMPYNSALDCELLKLRNKVQFVADAEAYPPKPGDVFLLPGADGREKHTGIVVKLLGDGVVETIEGNTSSDGSTEGHEVCWRVRRLKGLDYISIGA